MAILDKQPNHVSETKSYIDKASIDVFYHIIHAINKKKLINKTVEEIQQRKTELSVDIPKKVLVKSNNYKSLYKKIDALTNHQINYDLINKKGEKIRKHTVVISGSDFNKNKQYLTVHIPVSAQLYLLSTKVNYTSFNLKEALSFENYYSKLMYEFCCQYLNIKNRTLNYSINSFRARLNILQKYSKKENFKRKILDEPLKELKEKSSIYFDYRILKNKETGIEYLRFKILVDPKKHKLDTLAKENYIKVYNFLSMIYEGSINAQRLTEQIFNNSYIGEAKQRFERLNNDFGYGKLSKKDITHILNKSILPEYEIDINDF